MIKERQRHQLIKRLEQQSYLTQEEVAEAMKQVPRERFVNRSQVQPSQVYSDRPLPIGHGQTISAPHMVAWQTSLLDPESEDKVLEIGTGLGYQAAVLARIVARVVTLEVVHELAAKARSNLESYSNVEVVIKDGSQGYGQEAPYDKAIITCATPKIPKALRQQLKIGGQIVAPVGGKHSQQLKRLRKRIRVLRRKLSVQSALCRSKVSWVLMTELSSCNC